MAEPFAPYAGIEGAALTGGEGGDLLQKLLLSVLQGTAQIPQNVIDAAAKTGPPGLRREDYTDAPVPGGMVQAWQPGDAQRAQAVEAAMLPMGTGAIAGVPVRGAEAVLGAGPIRAYHGSPHNFDKFDMSKIGTGEGAQAYGHGLYFAENEGVARGYRDALSKPVPTINGRVQSAGVGKFNVVDDFGVQAGPFPTYEEARRSMMQNAGKMYEVNIKADPAHFLDWDKVLPMESPIREKIITSARTAFDKSLTGANRNIAKDAMLAAEGENLTGQGAYQQLARTNTKPGIFPEINLAQPSRASEMLLDAGIPGIKYLDQGSRFAKPVMKTTPHGDVISSHYPPETSNYVMFNDKLIEIMRKYGLAGLPAGVGALMGGGQSGEGS